MADSLDCRRMRASPASHRHFVWVAALAAAILLPLASIRAVKTTTTPQFAVTLPAPDASLAKSLLSLPTQAPTAQSPEPNSASHLLHGNLDGHPPGRTLFLS